MASVFFLLQRKELIGAGDKELEKRLDLEGASYGDEDPEDVKMARDELKVSSAKICVV